MKPLTYQQIFVARIVLTSTLRHIAQEHGCYLEGEWHFRTRDGGDAFLIVHQALAQLEAEFQSKRSRRRAA